MQLSTLEATKLKEVYRIEPQTGLFVEPVIIQPVPILNTETQEVEWVYSIPSDCIEVQPQSGFNRPKWDGVEWIEGGTPQAATPNPQWDAFLNAFRTPGNSLYLGAIALVSSASFECQDHWGNFKSLIQSTDASYRTVENLAMAIVHLKNLLQRDGEPLTTELIEEWNQMMTTYDFPEICLLS